MNQKLFNRTSFCLLMISTGSLGIGCAKDRATNATVSPVNNVKIADGGSHPAVSRNLDVSPAARPAAIAASAEQPKEIVRLVGRDSVITITTGPNGPLYSANTNTGRMIVSRVTLNDLRANHPEVYREVHGAASTDASPLIADLE